MVLAMSEQQYCRTGVYEGKEDYQLSDALAELAEVKLKLTAVLDDLVRMEALRDSASPSEREAFDPIAFEERTNEWERLEEMYSKAEVAVAIETALKDAKPEAKEAIDKPPEAASPRVEKRHNNWRSGPGRLGRALIHELMVEKKLSMRGLAEKFFYLWPGCQAYFEHPLKPNMLYSRWWTGTGRGYENEHPDKNPETRKYLRYAKAIVAADLPITDADVQRIVTEVANHVAERPTDAVPAKIDPGAV